MAEDKMDLAGLIATAKQQASRALSAADTERSEAENRLNLANEALVATVQEVAKVLDTQEIAGLLGESHRQVLYWVSHGTAKRTRTPKVEVVDGRTGEAVSGERAEIADLNPVFDPDTGLPDTGEDIVGAPA